MPKRRGAKPKAAKRVVAKRKAAKPKAARRVVAKRKAAKPKAARRVVAKRKVAKPKSAKRSGSTRPLTVFISWSGKRSKCLGNRLHQMLPIIIPKIKILFSPVFTPGDAWAKSVQRSIKIANYAILCVTKESLDSRWMNFEAGALWRSLKNSNTCPLLLDIEPSDLTGPLSQFQAKQFVKGEFGELCRLLGKRARMNSDQLRDNVDKLWTTLDGEVSSDLAKL